MYKCRCIRIHTCIYVHKCFYVCIQTHSYVFSVYVCVFVCAFDLLCLPKNICVDISRRLVGMIDDLFWKRVLI